MSTESPELPIEAPVGEAGHHTTEAFALLADETRLAILLALWDAYDPQADDNTVRFSELFDRVDYEDPGNFSYHLEKLDGPFVRQDADGKGYCLRTTGLKFVRSIIAGAGVQDVSLEAVEIDQECPFCGALTTIGYRDGLVIHACTECVGAAPEESEREGLLSMVPFDPAGLTDRSPREVRAASMIGALRGAQSMFEGVCPACSGSVDGWLEYCSDHAETGICEACGRKGPARAHFRCRTCRNHKIDPLEGLALFHPAVASFYDDHGISTRVHADEFDTVKRVYDLMDDHAVELVSVEPARAGVTATCDSDEIRLTFDETVRVVDVDR
jgi:DNA-binding transcriptional ArsR family regulator